MNAANRIGGGLPSYGVAQGSLFAVVGKGVGPADSQQATFPLPASAGLGGVSIKVAVGGSTVDAIMVYVSANEVDAILPSSTPLGTGTVTVTNSDSTATAPITVVKSAFGIFSSPGGYSLVFNVGDDGTPTPVSPTQSAQAGHNIMINGTGLGAIASDETQSGATDVPGTEIKVWIGAKEATVVSAGRGTCCAGIDPKFPYPQGIAAWDVIVATVPDGIEGCQVPVAVQIGSTVSNVGILPVRSAGGLCLDLTGIDFSNPSILSGMIKTGLINFTRVAVKVSTGAVTVDSLSDVGAAAFTRVDLGTDPVQIPVQALSGLLARTTGACTVFVFNSAFLVPPDPATPPGNPQTLLDAGPAINVKGANGSKSMTKQKDGGYGGTFASVSTIPLPTGVITQGGPPFLEAGAFPTDNGGGGADIGPFNITLNNPKPVVWSNMDQITTVNRAQGVTIRWTGGDPDTFVGIAGTANIVQGTVGIGGGFVCTEKATAGQFTVPSFITLGLPAVNNSGPGNLGSLNVSTSRFQYITIPGIDLSTFITTSGAGKTVAYQ
jgi:uncharacterized protein (TIGR03437 family)